MSGPDDAPDPGAAPPGLAGRRGLVVGAASGIGRGVAQALAAAGVALALVDRDAGVTELAGQLGAHPLVADVGEASAPETVVAEAVRALGGPPQLLVNSVGIQARGPAVELAETDWEVVETVNWRAVRRITTRVVREMQDAGVRGSIVNVTSMSVAVVLPGIVPYSTSKAALTQWTRGLAAELGAWGIRVNAVAPGYVRTGMTADLLADAEAARRIESGIPLGYIAEPPEIAPTVRFLLSEDARYVTGAVIPIDGGFSLGA